MKKQLIVQNLQQMMLFQQVGTAELEKLAEVCRTQIISEGEYVYRQGDESTTFYLVALGEVELIMELEGGSSIVVGRITQGGHFGETGLLTGKPRSVSAKVLSDSLLICIDKRSFHLRLLSNNLIHKQLDSALAERLRLAWVEQAETAAIQGADHNTSVDEIILFKQQNLSRFKRRRREKKSGTVFESKTAQLTEDAINRFATNSDPYLLSGENGTGKALIARQIHNQGKRSEGHYEKIDLQEQDPFLLGKLLFGTKQDSSPFAKARHAGVFERCAGGTVVLCNFSLMSLELQKKIVRAISSQTFSHVDSDELIAMQARIAFISQHSLKTLESSGKVLPELMEILQRQHFHVPALREHKRDLPRLIEHYLRCYSREYRKNITTVPPETLGMLMNYDWPGNLTELSSVIRRAVMLARHDEILSDHILLGLPKTEGKWEFNLLRLPLVRKIMQSRAYPALPRIAVGLFLTVTVFALFFGPRDANHNLGITLSWGIGWPLLFFSFFFMARIWCSVCTLAMPGTMLRAVVKPQRRTPQLIKEYSGWIMAVLCILVLWVEIVWKAHQNPVLTGWIILAVALGSTVTSVILSRRAWCRYLCPLGAINAIFAMPSILELRSNRHVCLNRCQDHFCFRGGSEKPGCPMFRHPYLVDNNRDCILCGECIKKCQNRSILLNLRLAPQELWNLQTPRRADSFLIVSLGAIFFPFVLYSQLAEFSGRLGETFAVGGVSLPQALISSLIFFAVIALCQIAYYLMVQTQAWYTGINRQFLLPMLGYGFIPLILGGYMAAHFGIFVSDAYRIIPNIQEMFNLSVSTGEFRLISQDKTHVLQILTILGGLFASIYATYRILLAKAPADDGVTGKTMMVPLIFLLTLAILFLAII